MWTIVAEIVVTTIAKEIVDYVMDED